LSLFLPACLSVCVSNVSVSCHFLDAYALFVTSVCVCLSHCLSVMSVC
jgi:hypothetical protein